MSCASANGSEDKFEFYIFQDDDNDNLDNEMMMEDVHEENSQDLKNLKTDPTMAETQDDKNYKQTIKHKEDVYDDKDYAHDKEDVKSTNENYSNSYQSITSLIADDEPVDDLLSLANDDVNAVETANLLLSEHQPNFVDFGEFNICLNNILNDEEVDSQLELSPSVVMSDTLTTNDVEELFKVNIDSKYKSQNHMPPTATSLNELKNISAINNNNNTTNVTSSNSSSSGSSSSCNNKNNNIDNTIININSNISNTSNKINLCQEQISQLLHNDNDKNGQENNDHELLNMVNFDDHINFSFSSELESNNTTTTSPYLEENSLNKSNTTNYKENSLLHHEHYTIDKNINIYQNNNHHNNNENNDNDVDLDLNMFEDHPISIQQTICNPTTATTVSASLTTTAANSNNIHFDVEDDDEDDDDNDNNNDTPQETALNNVIKRNSHSIVNIFQ